MCEILKKEETTALAAYHINDVRQETSAVELAVVVGIKIYCNKWVSLLHKHAVSLRSVLLNKVEIGVKVWFEEFIIGIVQGAFNMLYGEAAKGLELKFSMLAILEVFFFSYGHEHWFGLNFKNRCGSTQTTAVFAILCLHTCACVCA